MSSKTQQLERIRARKRTKTGLKRKNEVRNFGTTRAPLPLDRPNANERAQHAKTKA